MAADARFSDVRRFLHQHGWTLARISGSHHIFVKEGEGLLSIPVHKGRVKAVYIRRIEKAVGAPLD